MRLLIATLLFSFDIKVRKESEAWGVNLKANVLNEKRVGLHLHVRIIELGLH